MKSLENKLIAGIIAVGILLTVTGALSYKTLTDSIDTARQVANTHEILTEVEATLSTLKDAETGQRGFLIAGQEDYLQPFHQANEQIITRLERLKRLTAHNPRHHARLTAVEPLVKQKFDDLHRTVRLRRDEGFESAQKVELTNESKEKMDSLRQLFGEIKDEENTALQAHLATSEADTRNVVLTFVVLFALIITLFLLIFFLIKRDAAARDLLENKLREQATTDALTGVYNRREMTRLLEQEIVRAKRYESRLSLLLVDLDFFKAVNDTYGHQTGDELLKQTATILRESLRTVDTVARYGGEEFIVILPETGAGEAFMIAERLRTKIKEASFQVIQGNNGPLVISVTASIGMAELTAADNETSLIECADQALYQAKHKGRNRVIAFGV